MQGLSEIYPQYSDKVDFYALNIDATVSDSEIVAYGEKHGLTFPMGYPGGRMVADFNIKQQSSTVALKPSGLVLHKSGYGSGGLSLYEGLLRQLADLADTAQN